MCLTLSSTVCFREMRDLLLQIGVQRCAFAWAEGLHGVYNTGLRASSSESNRAKTLCPAQTEQTLEATGPGPMLVHCPFTERHLTLQSSLVWHPLRFTGHSTKATSQSRVWAGVKESSVGPQGRISSMHLGHISHYPALGGPTQSHLILWTGRLGRAQLLLWVALLL